MEAVNRVADRERGNGIEKETGRHRDNDEETQAEMPFLSFYQLSKSYTCTI